MSLPRLAVAISDLGSTFCDPFNIVVPQQRAAVTSFIAAVVVVVLLACTIIWAFSTLREKRLKRAFSGDPKMVSSQTRLARVRILFGRLVLLFLCLGLLSVGTWYIVSAEYRTMVKELHEAGCAGY